MSSCAVDRKLMLRVQINSVAECQPMHIVGGGASDRIDRHTARTQLTLRKIMRRRTVTSTGASGAGDCAISHE